MKIMDIKGYEICINHEPANEICDRCSKSNDLGGQNKVYCAKDGKIIHLTCCEDIFDDNCSCDFWISKRLDLIEAQETLDFRKLDIKLIN